MTDECPTCRPDLGDQCECHCHDWNPDRVASVEETMVVARRLAERHAELLRRLA